MAPTHAVEKIRQHCEKNKDNDVQVYVETTENEASEKAFMLEHARLATGLSFFDTSLLAEDPSMAFSHYVANGLFPKNVKISAHDMRKTPPYDLYILILYPLVYAKNRYGFMEIGRHIDEIRKWAKRAEKLFYAHMKTKKTTRNLLESFYNPDMEFPQWLQKLYSSIHNNEEVGQPLRIKMRTLRESDLTVYSDLIKYIEIRWSSLQNETDSFSRAMDDVSNMRHSNSYRLVAEKNDDVMQVFIALNSFIYDIDIILNILLMAIRNEKVNTIITLTGAQHASHIAKFFSRFSTCVVSKGSATGNLPAGNSQSNIVYVKDINIREKLKNIRDLNRNR